ncbi:MAG: nitric oxide synthase [Deltaproteobacteria bacterium]|nr:MAG: nitric oxide synthase [Deltaproteobacteria bacterium]RUA01770.1 MAG: nitric oxide synthase [Deltaproteobacteria bacterium]
MAKVLIIFATRTGETEEIGNLIGEGLRISGVDVTIRKITEVNNVSEINGYDGYVFGAPTYHGDMIQGMKTFLFLAEKADLEGKAGGAFGAFGWSGEAPDRIFDTMKHIFKMEMVSGPLRLKSASLGGGLQMAHDYGKEIAAKVTG